MESTGNAVDTHDGSLPTIVNQGSWALKVQHRNFIRLYKGCTRVQVSESSVLFIKCEYYRGKGDQCYN